MSTPATACELLQHLKTLRGAVFKHGETRFKKWQKNVADPDFGFSLRNMAYYLALRQRDQRDLQKELMAWGMSSLGRSEARVLETLDAVIATFQTLCDGTLRPQPDFEAFSRGSDLLNMRATTALGASPSHRRVRVMVTFPTEAATEYALVKDLLARGMNIARINCAHDNAEVWATMIANVRRAEAELGRKCMIHMDLGGPKIRVAKTSFKKKKLFYSDDTLLLVRTRIKRKSPYVHQILVDAPDTIEQLQVGHHVWFDDGKIGAVVTAIIPQGAVLHVTQASVDGDKIRPEKGVNLPDTPVKMSALTEKDLQDLDFVAHHADMIGYSFVQTAEDVQMLQQALQARTTPERLAHIALIAKIETVLAVRNLPEIIVQIGQLQPVGVMIARGDLAVELGFQRLAEIQEEILWVCESAHVPVIWATQVFENYVKYGTPTRAEITDAAMSQRAECVMLNKGAQIARALSALDDVLVRMSTHQFKKTAGLRALQSWYMED